MAPRKRTVVEPSTRVTRSSSRLTTKVNAESLKKKKAKKNPTSGKKSDGRKSKPAKIVAPVVEEQEEGEEKVEDGGGGFKGKTIIIEHCKQCQQFKIRAMKVKSGLEKAFADGDGVTVILNPEKPRRGCFEIREEGENGEKFISLLNMVRPFAAMKALDLDQVVADVIEKIK